MIDIFFTTQAAINETKKHDQQMYSKPVWIWNHGVVFIQIAVVRYFTIILNLVLYLISCLFGSITSCCRDMKITKTTYVRAPVTNYIMLEVFCISNSLLLKLKQPRKQMTFIIYNNAQENIFIFCPSLNHLLDHILLNKATWLMSLYCCQQVQ